MNKYEKVLYKNSIIKDFNNLETALFKLFFIIVKYLKIDKICNFLGDYYAKTIKRPFRIYKFRN